MATEREGLRGRLLTSTVFLKLVYWYGDRWRPGGRMILFGDNTDVGVGMSDQEGADTPVRTLDGGRRGKGGSIIYM